MQCNKNSIKRDNRPERQKKISTINLRKDDFVRK